MGPADGECFAMKCYNCNPKSFFCGWCLLPCADSNICHAHVRVCPINVNYAGNVFTDPDSPAQVFHDTHKQRRLQEIRNFLASDVSPDDREDVVAAIDRDIHDSMGPYEL